MNTGSPPIVAIPAPLTEMSSLTTSSSTVNVPPIPVLNLKSLMEPIPPTLIFPSIFTLISTSTLPSKVIPPPTTTSLPTNSVPPIPIELVTPRTPSMSVFDSEVIPVTYRSSVTVSVLPIPVLNPSALIEAIPVTIRSSIIASSNNRSPVMFKLPSKNESPST